MRSFNIMIKPASSLCNLRCKYCFYADVVSHREVVSYGIMDNEKADIILTNIFCDLQRGDHVTFAFQGGEPTMAGLPYYEHFTSYVDSIKNGVTVSYALQTNATLLTDEWCPLLKKYNFLLGISLDGMETTHNQCRIDSQGKGTYKKVLDSIKLLKKNKIEFNILMTLTKNMSRHPNQIWNFIVENDLRYVQFTPCLAPFGDSINDQYAITPSKFADFYIQIFKKWKTELYNGNYYSIKLFDDLVNLLAYSQSNACGLTGNCSPQVVVEADGSVFPCDFYTVDKWCAGNLCANTLAGIMASPVYSQFLSRPRDRSLCPSCRYYRMCNGSCERMHSQICFHEGEKECGFSKFLDDTVQDIALIAQNERQLSKRQNSMRSPL